MENNPSINQGLLDSDDVSHIDPEILAEEEKERKKFTDHSPLVTLLIMSLGPLGLFIYSSFDAIDLIVVSKGLKEIEPEVAEVIGFASTSFFIVLNFGTIVGQALTAYVTKLLGQRKREQAALIANDIIRVSFLISIPVAVGFNFIIKPFLRFSNCPDELLDLSYKYLLPCVYLFPFFTLNTTEVYFLQSIGQAVLSGILKVVSAGVSTSITSLLVFAFHVNSDYINFSVMGVEVVMSMILFTLIYTGKFSVKPKFSMLIKKFYKETLSAFGLALPILFQVLYQILPPALVLKSMTSVDPENAGLIGSAFSAFNKVSSILISLVNSFSCGFLPAATHAYGAKNYKRIYQLLIWAIIISTLIVGIIQCVVVFAPGIITGWILNDAEHMDFANNLLPIPFYVQFLTGIYMPLSQFLVSIGKPIFSTIGWAVQTACICTFAFVLPKIKNEASFVMNSYNISNAIVFAFFVVVFIIHHFKLKKQIAEEKDNRSMSELTMPVLG
ncbi:MatE family protein [Histomonas meleagridis]|uniref:MatE family protein n=1 Tax=Histomonas meleagridis TaxID=135588 RepID=UPI003559C6C3|nr:MatE family protein [Histomonas meleagridis]KAH0807135.1 MatE family protein [Histomonas meleagridis]